MRSILTIYIYALNKCFEQMRLFLSFLKKRDMMKNCGLVFSKEVYRGIRNSSY